MRLPYDTQRQLLFIFRESLNNIQRHAEAENVQVDLSWGEDDLTILIKDDGRGFNPAEVDGDNHFGLEIMKERAANLGGTLEIRSEVGKGSELRIWLPTGGS